MAYAKIYEFPAAVRGYHHYKKFWNPEPQQVLNCYHEKNNAYDRYVIMTCEIGKDEIPVGHLPMEISRVTKFFIDRGATVTAELTSEYYRRSPLIQGGLEIPCKITAKISGTVINLLFMEKYIQLLQEFYTEPKDEEILGSYVQVEAAEGVNVTLAVPRNPPVQKKKKKSDVQQKKDIQKFFNRDQNGRTEENSNQTTKKTNKRKADKVIVLD